MAVSYMAMLDGIVYATNSGKDEAALLSELSKKSGEEADYLEKNRAYRSEEDVFEHYTESERNTYFGKAPATVYENLTAINKYPEKLTILKRNSVMTDKIIESYKTGALERWATDIEHRILTKYIDEVRTFRPLHSNSKALDLDVSNWMKIDDLRHYIVKDTYNSKSLATRLKNAFHAEDYEQASRLYIELDEKMEKLRALYDEYKKNLLDI